MAAFNSRDLVAWCRQIIEAQAMLDRAQVVREGLPELEKKHAATAKKLAETLEALERASADQASLMDEHEKVIGDLRKSRIAEQAGLETDKAARAKAREEGERGLRSAHAQLAAGLRNERDDLQHEVESLKTQKTELLRALREARDNVKV